MPEKNRAKAAVSENVTLDEVADDLHDHSIRSAHGYIDTADAREPGPTSTKSTK